METGENSSENTTTKKIVGPLLLQNKIPRPPNAFMLYANENRKTMAHLYPADSNKEISRRLGQTWKDLSLLEKNKYFQKAKDIDLEHKRKYPWYVYNPKDARMRKAVRSSLKDRSIGGSPMLPRPGMRNTNLYNHNKALYQSLFTRIKKQSPMWSGTSDLSSLNHADFPYVNELLTEGAGTSNTIINENLVNLNNFEATLFGSNSEEERSVFEREKPNLEAAENYMNLLKQSKIEDSPYLPISSTKFIKNPELYTNNAEYHREYIIKYFNHIPDYETYNVTTEDGVSFPYVTIPNLFIRQKI